VTTVPLLHKLAAGMMALYGALSIGLGTAGFVEKASIPSLAAGGLAGLLLLGCAVVTLRRPVWSLAGAILVALALLGFFTPRLIRERQALGEFVGTLAGQTAVLMTVGGLLVVLTSGMALATRPRLPTGP
jgi:uncharacterized membrane protein (UPF0136 family)